MIFAVLIGILISGPDDWGAVVAKRKRSARAYYIKAGLVILGTSILMQEIFQAGSASGSLKRSGS
ncbi:MAG: hypothetical protein WKF84_29040 [Pyrinomonadaceae bacterium]